MSRHQERDLEAGGPGFGTLDTRKRAWKGPDGSVLEKRPRLNQTRRPAPWTPSGPESSTHVISPPGSDEGRQTNVYNFDVDCEEDDLAIDAPDASVDVPQRFHEPPSSARPHQNDYEHPQSHFHNSKPQSALDHEKIEYYPTFQPDTASSFNMPYTTALDYTWLFNLEVPATSVFGHADSGAAFHNNLFGSYEREQIPTNEVAAEFQVQHPTPQSQENSTWQCLAEDNINYNAAGGMAFYTATSSLQTSPDTHLRQSSTLLVRDASTDPALRGDRQRDASFRANAGSRALTPLHPSDVRDDPKDYPKPLGPERPLSMLRKPDTFPRVDQTVRERLLLVIEASNPCIPDQTPDSLLHDHPLLSITSLQSWLDLFFTHFNTTYPLIHMPTFEPSKTEPLLLLSIILLGATYSDKNSHQMAVCIHDVIRPSIFAHAGFSPSPKLWTLQTLLLVECFGKSRAGQKQHDLSHLFHGLLINLIRRSDCQSVASTPGPPEGGDLASLDSSWKRWAECEQKKRLALLCFMWDTQHAVLFCQSLCMSSFELRCAMPHDQGVWEAQSAESWATAWGHSRSSPDIPEIMFLPMLKSYLAPGPASETRSGMNALSLVLVLHGIMSVAWDMQRRDHTSLGVYSVVGQPSWRDLLGQAYERWKVDFEQYCREAAAGNDTVTSSEWPAFATAYRSVRL